MLPPTAGRTTTSEELEDMLESGNPAIFASGVSINPSPVTRTHGTSLYTMAQCVCQAQSQGSVWMQHPNEAELRESLSLKGRGVWQIEGQINGSGRSEIKTFLG